MSFLELSDRLVIASLPAAALIRVGNFFNSEILGIPTNIPWAITFIRVDPLPRHPAMLYEAAAYFLVFCALYFAYWRTGITRFPGRILGTALAVSSSWACCYLSFIQKFSMMGLRARFGSVPIHILRAN